MRRDEILGAVLPAVGLNLWAPILTPYAPADGGGADVDAVRMERHAASLIGAVTRFMLGGTTGDGWELSDGQFQQLLDLAAAGVPGGPVAHRLIALLRPDAASVVELVGRVHAAAGTDPGAGLRKNVDRCRELGLVGLCVCPPVDPAASQDDIVAHYGEIAAAARLPLAVYQLPQITGCAIAPDTFARLVAEHEEIILFKDSSGGDDVAASDPAPGGPQLVRGAEDGYAEALRPLGGPYDGLLLSTANVFAPALRRLMASARDEDGPGARRLSRMLADLVARLFAAGGGEPPGNPFANVNRAVDHLMAHGSAWREAGTPLLWDGSRLPAEYIEARAAVLAPLGLLPDRGYLAGC